MELVGTHIPISSTVSCRNRVLRDAGDMVALIGGIRSITCLVAFKTYKITVL
jgi:hypothetical protein